MRGDKKAYPLQPEKSIMNCFILPGIPIAGAPAFTKIFGGGMTDFKSNLNPSFWGIIRMQLKMRKQISLFCSYPPPVIFAQVSFEKAVTVIVAKQDNLVNICEIWLENPHAG